MNPESLTLWLIDVPDLGFSGFLKGGTGWDADFALVRGDRSSPLIIVLVDGFGWGAGMEGPVTDGFDSSTGGMASRAYRVVIECT